MAIVAGGLVGGVFVLFWVVPFCISLTVIRFWAEVTEHVARGCSNEFMTTRNNLSLRDQWLIHIPRTRAALPGRHRLLGRRPDHLWRLRRLRRLGPGRVLRAPAQFPEGDPMNTTPSSVPFSSDPALAIGFPDISVGVATLKGLEVLESSAAVDALVVDAVARLQARRRATPIGRSQASHASRRSERSIADSEVTLVNGGHRPRQWPVGRRIRPRRSPAITPSWTSTTSPLRSYCYPWRLMISRESRPRLPSASPPAGRSTSPLARARRGAPSRARSFMQTGRGSCAVASTGATGTSRKSRRQHGK